MAAGAGLTGTSLPLRATMGLAFLLVLVAAAYLSSGADQALENPAAADPVIGAGLYAQNCAACHGAQLEGQKDWQRPNQDGVLPAPPHDETGHTWHHGDGLLFEYIKLGGREALARQGVSGFNSAMPGFAGVLEDAEIRHILAFIKSTWPERLQAGQRMRTEAENAPGS